MSYDGSLYAPVGDFLREAYLDFSFAKGTLAEVDFLQDLLALPGGARVLDVGCGPGRHSLELARRGLRTHGIDISQGFIEVARQQAQAEALAAEFTVADMRDVSLPCGFDAAICLCEGAFGLAGDEIGHRRVLANVAEALLPGAPFVLTALHALCVARQLGAAEEDDGGRTARFDPLTCTSLETVEIRNPAGDRRTVELYTTAFTYRELKWLLEGAGFHVEECYGCIAGHFSKRPLGVDDYEIMVVARRV